MIADTAHWHRLAMLLRPEELARALAPSLALHLLSADGPPVLLLADDVLVRGPLDDLARLSREHGAVLVPRRDPLFPTMVAALTPRIWRRWAPSMTGSWQ